MTKRPSVFDLGALMVKKPTPPTAAAADERADATSTVSETESKSPRATLKRPPPPPSHFRTSVYFSRAVHDVLRDIAHEERKSITDLINEGLDHVLTSRNYPTTATIRAKKS
jgi:hypothetical protein